MGDSTRLSTLKFCQQILSVVFGFPLKGWLAHHFEFTEKYTLTNQHIMSVVYGFASAVEFSRHWGLYILRPRNLSA